MMSGGHKVDVGARNNKLISKKITVYWSECIYQFNAEVQNSTSATLFSFYPSAPTMSQSGSVLFVPMYSMKEAKPSFSHSPSHQAMVTRLPNHCIYHKCTYTEMGDTDITKNIKNMYWKVVLNTSTTQKPRSLEHKKASNNRVYRKLHSSTTQDWQLPWQPSKLKLSQATLHRRDWLKNEQLERATYYH